MKGQRVTHTACGVWHSAAVAAERTESGDGLGQLPFLEAHAIQEKLASIYDQLDGVCPTLTRTQVRNLASPFTEKRIWA